MSDAISLSDAIRNPPLLPAFPEPARRLRDVAALDRPPAAELTSAIESDVALTFNLLRFANREDGAHACVPSALDSLGGEKLRRFAGWVPVCSPLRDPLPAGFRMHAALTARATRSLARHLPQDDPSSLVAAALVHDIGKLALHRAEPVTYGRLYGSARTPENRRADERRTFSVDHAALGAMLARGVKLPASLGVAIASHHDATVGPAGLIRLADMIALLANGSPVDTAACAELTDAFGLSAQTVEALVHDLLQPAVSTPAVTAPCPLSRRELAMLRGLAKGKTYRQIGEDEHVAESTVRSHLHHAYRKLGVADRAQAVLRATRHGWLPATA